jgi:hypothetical protein
MELVWDEVVVDTVNKYRQDLLNVEKLPTATENNTTNLLCDTRSGS